LAIAPLDAGIGAVNPSTVSHLEAMPPIDGQPCFKVVSSGPLRDEITVTDDDRLLPLEQTVYRPDSTSKLRSISLQYERLPQIGWFPSAFRIVRYANDGRIIEVTESSEIEATVNQPLADETFQIQFPRGTWVNDLNSGESYLVRPGKPNRVVLNGEFNGANLEELLNSETPYPSRRHGYLVAFSLIVLTVILAFMYWPRRWGKKLQQNNLSDSTKNLP
ncbi:hypothetical protein, partial [Roseimaritima sediminicola]|uniref:hypothetical protein n=1 Tax=Roseimaritima sediminicola TaxID=2662066 RepID=UPI001F3E44DF